MILFRLNEEIGIVTEDFEYIDFGLNKCAANSALDVQPFCHCDGNRCACLDNPWFSGGVGSGDPHGGRL